MNAIAMLLALAAGPGLLEEPAVPKIFSAENPSVEEISLPRSLSEEFVASAPAAAGEVTWWAGTHVGISYFTGGLDITGFVLGAQLRTKILPWLGADASLDFQIASGGYFAVPLVVSALFYLPIEGPVHPYAIAGVGVVYVGDPVNDLFIMFSVGVGSEFEVGQNTLLDVNFRYSIVNDTGGAGDFLQLLVGLKFKL